MAETGGLKKTLGLADVYAISTGAMFSSGFFLLPGIAAIQSGPSVALAYLLAGVLIMPAMFSVAELATAMPRAGGAYYFLDRSMGPLMGTIGGLGTWLALVLKTAFALLGMGAYLMLFVDVPIKPIAVGLTALFALLNIVGAKETSGLQRVLVASLVMILGAWVVQGLGYMFGQDAGAMLEARLSGQFLENGVDGLFATVGIVFVSYAGLTKVASVAEEVRDPDRNIPLGMMLSLATATAIYVIGVGLMTLVLEPSAFHASYTPVADAGEVIITWIPTNIGLWLIVIAATAAFASTGNAGILSSSRYPMAMARDNLVPSQLGGLSKRFGTPVLSVLLTSAMIILLIVAFDIAAVAKLASAFQLMLFGLICLALIVMRESRIDYYQPGYRSPFYPWMQIAGMLIPIWLIVQMGWLAILFTAGVVAGCIGWYLAYANKRTVRHGAVYHVFERLGRQVYRGLDDELRDIVAEKGLDESDPVESLVIEADVMDVHGEAACEALMGKVAQRLADLAEDEDALGLLEDRLVQGAPALPVIARFGLAQATVPGLKASRLLLVRADEGILLPAQGRGQTRHVYAMAVLIGPEADLSLHLRVLAHFGRHVDDVDFEGAWLEARSESELKEILLREDRFHHLRIDAAEASGALIGLQLKDSNLPKGVIIALLQRRDGSVFVPGAFDELHNGDRLTAIGDPDDIRALRRMFEPEGDARLSGSVTSAE